MIGATVARMVRERATNLLDKVEAVVFEMVLKV